MKTFLPLIILFFPLWCIAQEEKSDTISWFRFNGKTYYARDSVGQFKPAVVLYELIDESKPSLGYRHTIGIVDFLEKKKLIFSTNPTMALPKILDKKYAGKRGIFGIYSTEDTLGSLYTNITLYNSL